MSTVAIQDTIITIVHGSRQFFVCSILLLSGVWAQAQSPLEQAVTLARQRRYAEAAQLLQGIPEPALTPQRIAFHRLKAAVASGLGHADDAATEMEAALALNQHDASLLAAAAVAELSAGDLAERLGDSVAAANAYQKAVEFAPEREEYRIRFALELIQHYSFEPAIAVLQQAAPLFPKSAKLLMLLGVAQYAVRHSDDAVAALTDAVEIDPGMEPAWKALITVVLDSTAAPPRRTVEALCRWNQVACGASELRISREQNDAARREQAIAELRSAPAGDPIARCELGRAYEWSADWANARREMEACVALDPSAQNHYRLGLIYSALHLPQLAAEQMKLRAEASAKSAGENALRNETVQAFQYVLK